VYTSTTIILLWPLSAVTYRQLQHARQTDKFLMLITPTFDERFAMYRTNLPDLCEWPSDKCRRSWTWAERLRWRVLLRVRMTCHHPLHTKQPTVRSMVQQPSHWHQCQIRVIILLLVKTLPNADWFAKFFHRLRFTSKYAVKSQQNLNYITTLPCEIHCNILT